MQNVGASCSGCLLIDPLVSDCSSDSETKSVKRRPAVNGSAAKQKQQQELEDAYPDRGQVHDQSAAASSTSPSLASTSSSASTTPTTAAEPRPESKLIGIDGKWYDITKFIPHHPGGPVIEQFVGKDATAVFKAMHGKDVLKHMKPVGHYKVNNEDPANQAFAQLHTFFLEMGFFNTSYAWFAMKSSVTFILLSITIYAVINSQSFLHYCFSGLMLAAFWQQAGFLMHDFMHNSCFHDRRIDRWIGTMFGTCCVGINSHWWRDEHFVHHALTNTVDYDIGFADPQMHEDIWAQNSKLFPFYTMALQHKLIRIQHYTFLPVCMLLGRIAIVVDGFRRERRWYEWAGLLLHNSWLLMLLWQLPSWQAMFVVYSVASVLEGILHVQLLISHYAKEFFERKDICESKCWYRMQVDCNINIKNPVWLDWFHGGLNFHIEHHLFPLMPRHRFREASKYIRSLCKQLDITYDECCWTDAICRTLRHLKSASQHFSLDPR